MSEPKAQVPATAWEIAAFAAAHRALRAAGVHGDGLRPRDRWLETDDRWMSFEFGAADEVVWVAQVGGVAPYGTLVVDTPEGAMGVWRYPNDPGLPGLGSAVRPGGLPAPLEAVARARGVTTATVEVVALRPLQAAAVRIGERGRCVYLKVLPPAIVETVVHIHTRAAAAGLPSPAVLGVDSTLGLVMLSEVAGIPLADALERGAPLPDPTAIWALIEQLGAVDLGRVSPARPLGAPHDPQCPPSLMTIHGDLHDRQLLVDDRGAITGIVDLDDAGTGDLLDDLARLIAHIALRADIAGEHRVRIERFAHALRREFADHVDDRCLGDRIAMAAERLRRRMRAMPGSAAIDATT